MSNRCPICAGVGRVLALGACRDPIPVHCPECAGLDITPASADDHMRLYSVGEITAMLLARPALPAPIPAATPAASDEALPQVSSG